jgi:hypothetical protein
VQMMRKPQQPQEEVSTSPAYESYA